MELHVWKYLLTHTFRDLEEEHGVFARPNATFDKFSLNYDQIMAKSGNPVSDQCRGLIIRPRSDSPFWTFARSHDVDWKDIVVGECEILAWPMNRFYNYGDHAMANIDWNDPNLKVWEKVDGTCIIVYWDSLHGKWHCATRSVSEADIPIRGDDLAIGDMTFAQLFLKALKATREEISGKSVDWECDGPDKVIHLSKENTYVFELVSRHNQIVVDYPEPRVYLLAVRHLPTGEEVHPDAVRIQHVRRPRTWPLNDAAAIGAFVNTMSPSELEGVVVCDSKFNRGKIKSMAYVLAHKSKDTVTASPRNALEAIILEKIDDVIPLVPKDVGEKMLKMQAAYAAYCKSIDAKVAEFKADAAGVRKRYAELVILSGDWQTPYFNLWENRAGSTHEWVKGMCEKGKLAAGALDTILSKLTM